MTSLGISLLFSQHYKFGSFYQISQLRHQTCAGVFDGMLVYIGPWFVFLIVRSFSDVFKKIQSFREKNSLFFRCNYRSKLSLRGLEQKVSTRIWIFSKTTHQSVVFLGVLVFGKRSFLILFRTFRYGNPVLRKLEFFLSIIFVVSWFTLEAKFSIGIILWYLRHYCDCQKVPKIAVSLEFFPFSNSCHSKTTGLSCSIKISVRIFESMTRFSSEKVRRIFWSLQSNHFFWKLLKRQSIIKNSYFKNLVPEAGNCRLYSTNHWLKQKF